MKEQESWGKEFNKDFGVFKWDETSPITREVFPCEGGYCEMDVSSIKEFITELLTSRDTYWKGTNQVFVNNIIEDIENMKGVYSAQDAITKALEIIKRHTIR